MGKKVCIVAPISKSNDIRIYQKEAKSLVDFGYDIYFISQKGLNSVSHNVKFVFLHPYKSFRGRVILQFEVLNKIKKINPEIIHFHNPDTLILGFLFKALGKKVIYDVHEDYSKRILIRRWIPSFVRKNLARTVVFLEKKAGVYFDFCICTQNDVKTRFGEKSIVIENPPVIEGHLIESAYRKSKNIKTYKEFVAVYVGGISENKGLFLMINAIEKVNHVLPAKLLLIGPEHYDGEIEKAKNLKGWNFVDYKGYLEQSEAFAYILKSNVGLLLTESVGGLNSINPNKIFEYQLFGIPFIASNHGLWKEQSPHGAGLFIENNIDSLAQAIIYLAINPEKANMMGEIGKRFIEFEYNWNIEKEKLRYVYDSLI